MNKKLLNLFLVIMMLAVLVSTALAAPSAQGEGQDDVVVADDTLWGLADKYLGNGAAYPAIVEYTNRKHAEDLSYAEITNPALLQVGWKLYIPSAKEAAEFMATGSEGLPAGVFRVGDSWILVDQEAYRWGDGTLKGDPLAIQTKEDLLGEKIPQGWMIGWIREDGSGFHDNGLRFEVWEENRLVVIKGDCLYQEKEWEVLGKAKVFILTRGNPQPNPDTRGLDLFLYYSSLVELN